MGCPVSLGVSSASWTRSTSGRKVCLTQGPSLCIAGENNNDDDSGNKNNSWEAHSAKKLPFAAVSSLTVPLPQPLGVPSGSGHMGGPGWNQPHCWPGVPPPETSLEVPFSPPPPDTGEEGSSDVPVASWSAGESGLAQQTWVLAACFSLVLLSQFLLHSIWSVTPRPSSFSICSSGDLGFFTFTVSPPSPASVPIVAPEWCQRVRSRAPGRPLCSCGGDLFPGLAEAKKSGSSRGSRGSSNEPTPLAGWMLGGSSHTVLDKACLFRFRPLPLPAVCSWANYFISLMLRLMGSS